MIWKFILVQVLATQEIQDGVQDGRRFLPIKAKYLVKPRNFIYNDLKGVCLIFLSAIYQLFIKYFNIK